MDDRPLPRGQAQADDLGMSKIGSNLRMTAQAGLRSDYDRIFVDVFGCKAADVSDEMRVYSFPEGGNVGVRFVDGSDQPTRAQYFEFGTWVEFVSDDADAKIAALLEAGVERLDYYDKERSYFQLPGGQVFRVCSPAQL